MCWPWCTPHPHTPHPILRGGAEFAAELLLSVPVISLVYIFALVVWSLTRYTCHVFPRLSVRHEDKFKSVACNGPGLRWTETFASWTPFLLVDIGSWYTTACKLRSCKLSAFWFCSAVAGTPLVVSKKVNVKTGPQSYLSFTLILLCFSKKRFRPCICTVNMMIVSRAYGLVVRLLSVHWPFVAAGNTAATAICVTASRGLISLSLSLCWGFSFSFRVA